MILEEFSNLITNIIDKDFPVREIPLCFNQSMKIQVNEVELDKHYNMTFPEFIEAFCRVVDKLSPYPPMDGQVNFLI